MPASRGKSKPKGNHPKTTFSSRTSPFRPWLGLSLLGVALLIGIALLGYDPRQPGLVEAFADSTQRDFQSNPLGAVGRDLGYLLTYLLGIGAYVLPGVLLWAGLLTLFRRSHWMGLGRWLSGLLLILLVSGFGAFWFKEDGLDRFWIQGRGGAFGYYIYDDFLFYFFGAGLSGLLLAFLILAGSIFFFRLPVASLWPGLARASVFAKDRIQERREGALVAWKERSAEWKTAREERRRDKAARKQSRMEGDDSGEAAAKPSKVRGGRGEDSDDWRESRILPNPGRNQSPGKGRVQPPPRNRKASAGRMVPAAEDEEAAQEVGAGDDTGGAVVGQGFRIVTGERVEKAKPVFPQRKGGYKFPPISLLSDSAEMAPTELEDHEQTAFALQRTLEEFGVKVELGEVHMGPVITRYEVLPAAGVRVERIANLERNIGMSLKAQSVRILAPVPGKGCVGVEVPNRYPSPVCLREIIESRAWVDAKAEIPLVLGKEVSGKPLVADLTKMPHLLIAGSTGSGKTVCINSIIASLLYHSSPSELRFIMIDPKIVEMQVYNDLPHMLIPVVTEPKKVPGALKWLISEMERRYRIFADAGVRNIAGFNAKLARDRAERERASELDADMTPEERAALSELRVPREEGVTDELPKEKLPYIVCLVDELADLMMVAPADIETCIARLAQLARAAGIHLVIATQRPSVNVITGVIKANLPSRISFKVASKIDSRTILDESGADALIGKGDMLFVPPGAHNLVRAQGAFVSDEEINSIVDYLKVNGPPNFLESVQEQIDSSDEGEAVSGDWDDDLVPQALEVIRSSKRASTSMLQRRLKIGYNRAARIMEILEEEGYVGPENGAQPREILRDLD